MSSIRIVGTRSVVALLRLRRLFRASAIALTLALVSSASSAQASDAVGTDEVSLKNGGTIRGTIISVEPGSKVVISEGEGKPSRTLAWAEVADVERGKYDAAKEGDEKAEPGAAGPGYSAPIPEEEEDPPPSGPGVVKVHIESEEPVTLYERGQPSVVSVGIYSASFVPSRPVCQSPCDRVIDGSRGQQYFIGGADIPESSSFKLRDHSADTTIGVSPGSRGMRTAGYWLISIGATGVAAGAVMLPVSIALSDGPIGSTDGGLIGGAVSLGAGAAVLASGIVLMVVGRTTVDVDSTARATKDPKESASKGQRFAIDERPAAIAPRYWLGEF